MQPLKHTTIDGYQYLIIQLIITYTILESDL